MANEFYLAVGEYCWGNGTTKQEAVRKARSIGRPFKKGFDVYRAKGTNLEPPYVDEMGRAYFPGEGVTLEHVSGPNFLEEPSA